MFKMIIWALMWLYFKFEFSIDWGKGGNLTIDWLPSVATKVSPKDENGHRMWSIEMYFLIFGVSLAYYYPAFFKFNEEGEVIGKNVFPECATMQVE